MNDEKLYGSVVVKVVAILDFLRDNGKNPTLSEIAEEIGVTKGTASKIMNTMQILNLANKEEETGRFSVGTKLIGYGNAANQKYSFKEECEPILEEIHQKFGETIHVGVEQNGKITYIGKKEAVDSVALKSRIGDVVEIYASAMGKAILAEKSSVEIKEYFKLHSLKPLTEHTLVTPNQFVQEIKKIRNLGFSVDNEENELGVKCFGIALVAYGHVYGALSISVPMYRLDEQKEKEIIQSLLHAKQRIQEKL